MGAGVLIFNDQDKLLIVKPSYKDYWSLPGGVVEDGESPRAGCLREVKEEIGLNLSGLAFVCLDYTCDTEKGESLQFVFTAKMVDDPIKIDNQEIEDYRFVSEAGALKLVGGNLQRRLPKCFEAVKQNKAIYLENGE